jgi:hypothetical protein
VIDDFTQALGLSYYTLYMQDYDAYTMWQAWLQKTQPRLLVLWGKHDLSFDLGEPERYRKDVRATGAFRKGGRLYGSGA